MKGYIGIDLSLDNFTATFLASDQGQERQTTLAFPVSKEGWQSFCQELELFRATCKQVLIGLESSGPYTALILAHLLSLPHPVYVLNPNLIRHFRQSQSLRPLKTDPVDANTIARFLQQASSLPQPVSEVQEIALLAREYEALSQEIAALKNRIRQHVHVLFPELAKNVHLFSQAILRLLQACPSAKAIAQAPQETLAAILQPKGHGRAPSITAQRLRQLAQNSFGIPNPARQALLQSQIRRLLFLLDERKRLEGQLLELVQSWQEQAFNALRSIKGMGNITTATFLAELGPLPRFPKAKSLVAYAGLDPSVHESGRYRGTSRLSKRGNRHLRRILRLIAQKLTCTTERFRQAYAHYRQQGRSHREALVIVARKILITFYAILSRHQPFQDLPIGDS
jgi:transposase